MRRRSRLLALTLVAGLVCATTPGLAQAARLKPEDAAEKRDAALSETAGLDNRAAADRLVAVAEELGDPELFLAASELLLQQAKLDSNEALAARAEELAHTAHDIAAYLADGDNYSATIWRPVTRERAEALVPEAKAAAQSAVELVATIEAERRAAEEAARAQADAATEDEGKRERQPGSGMIIGGSAALVLGVGGLAMFGAGLALGVSNQREAESLDLSMAAERDRLPEIDRRGAQANTIAYVGGAVGAVGLATGIALIVVGLKKRKAGGDPQEARVQVGGYFSPEGGGLQLQGSF